MHSPPCRGSQPVGPGSMVCSGGKLTVRMRGVVMAGGLVLAALVPCVSGADEVARLRAADALETTDQRIAVAESFVGANPSMPAEAELGAAHQGQSRARAAFTTTQFLTAVSASLSAREHADRAIAIVRNLPDPDRVQAQVERTRDALDRARHRVDACESTRASAMVHVALAMQERAEGAMDESRYLAALQLTMSARERVTRAMRLCGLEETPSESAGRGLQRTDELLVRAHESLDSGSLLEVRDLLARAQSIQAQARAEARLERFESALRLTQSARSLAQRAARPERVLRGSESR
jgi:hypothetical protein